MTVQDLPFINACLNALATVFLALGLVFIKKGNKTAHRNCMISAFVTSAMFLACYLTYHINTEADAVCRAGVVPPDLPRAAAYPRRAGGGNFATHFHHTKPCA